MSDFETFLERAGVAGPERLIPGCVLVVANKDGVIYEKCVGVQSVDIGSSLASKSLTTSNTMWIASCTKLMTAIAVLQCVEKGLLDLDEDISKKLNEWRDADILKGFEEKTGEPILETARNKLTLRLLLTHSSGLGYTGSYPQLVKFDKYRKAHKPKKWDRGAFHDTSFIPLLYEPGTSWSYGVGSDWAGRLVECVNGGQRLGNYMKENIWGPLGMNSTTFRLQERQDILDRRPDMTLRLDDGSLALSPTRFWPEDSPDDVGGGGVYCSSDDYIKLLIAILKNDGTLLRTDSIDKLFLPQLVDGGRALKDWLYMNTDGETTPLVGGIPKSADVSYSLGGLVVQDDVKEFVEGREVQRRKKGSMSWCGVPNLHWVIDRESGIVLWYASQLLPQADTESTVIFKRFEEAVYMGEIKTTRG